MRAPPVKAQTGGLFVPRVPRSTEMSFEPRYDPRVNSQLLEEIRRTINDELREAKAELSKEAAAIDVERTAPAIRMQCLAMALGSGAFTDSTIEDTDKLVQYVLRGVKPGTAGSV
jgi:hypothetical protein